MGLASCGASPHALQLRRSKSKEPRPNALIFIATSAYSLSAGAIFDSNPGLQPDQAAPRHTCASVIATTSTRAGKMPSRADRSATVCRAVTSACVTGRAAMAARPVMMRDASMGKRVSWV